MTISRLENIKATGHDQIPAELIKEGGKELKKVIYKLSFKTGKEEIISQLVEIWHNMTNPKERRSGSVQLIQSTYIATYNIKFW
jgi:hypothetical protein